MKRMKKLLAFLTACMMIVGSVNMMAFADPATPSEEMTDPSFDNTLQISGLTEGDIVKYYKILEWDGSNKSEGAYGGWKFVAHGNIGGQHGERQDLGSAASSGKQHVG